MTAIDLLACPFCKGSVEKDYGQYYRPINGAHLGRACAIYCLACGANMTECHDNHPGVDPEDIMSQLVAAWNTRTLPTVTADPLGAEWMPIATAPKDGTEIVIWRDGWSVFPVASWGDYPENPVSDSAENDVWMGGWLFSKFLTLGEEEGFLGWNTDEMPTHWTHVPSTKPIPAPTDDDLDRAALARPKVRKLVEELTRIKQDAGGWPYDAACDALANLPMEGE